MREELLKGLTEEQIAKVKECKTSEEILALAKEEGVTLSDEQLAAVSGGGLCRSNNKCPKCGSEHITDTQTIHYIEIKCKDCGYKWKV